MKIKVHRNFVSLAVFPAIGFTALASLGLSVPVSTVNAGPTTTCEFMEVDIPPARGIETPQEKVLRLEQAFYDALNAYDECQTALSSTSASAAAGSGGASGVASGSAAGTGAGSALDSGETDGQPSSDDVGSSVANLNPSPSSAPSLQDLEEGAGQGGGIPSQVPLDNGAVPEDIQEGDDDDIVAQQIREAATAEPDPVVRERLWADYRKYKGLPPR